MTASLRGNVFFADSGVVFDDMNHGHRVSAPESVVFLEPVNDGSCLDRLNVQFSIVCYGEKLPRREVGLEFDRVEVCLQ